VNLLKKVSQLKEMHWVKEMNPILKQDRRMKTRTGHGLFTASYFCHVLSLAVGNNVFSENQPCHCVTEV
jgi:hypothetical protein